MTTLGCNVNACSHNKDNCCCLSSIEVHGNVMKHAAVVSTKPTVKQQKTQANLLKSI